MQSDLGSMFWSRFPDTYSWHSDCTSMARRYAEGWNFGPNDEDAKPVEWIVQRLCEKWGGNANYEVDKASHPHEAHYLKLDCSKAKAALNWRPRWYLDKTIDSIVDWTLAYRDGQNIRDITLQQLEDYLR